MAGCVSRAYFEGQVRVLGGELLFLFFAETEDGSALLDVEVLVSRGYPDELFEEVLEGFEGDRLFLGAEELEEGFEELPDLCRHGAEGAGVGRLDRSGLVLVEVFEHGEDSPADEFVEDVVGAAGGFRAVHVFLDAVDFLLHELLHARGLGLARLVELAVDLESGLGLLVRRGVSRSLLMARASGGRLAGLEVLLCAEFVSQFFLLDARLESFGEVACVSGELAAVFVDGRLEGEGRVELFLAQGAVGRFVFLQRDLVELLEAVEVFVFEAFVSLLADDLADRVDLRFEVEPAVLDFGAQLSDHLLLGSLLFSEAVESLVVGLLDELALVDERRDDVDFGGEGDVCDFEFFSEQLALFDLRLLAQVVGDCEVVESVAGVLAALLGLLGGEDRGARERLEVLARELRGGLCGEVSGVVEELAVGRLALEAGTGFGASEAGVEAGVFGGFGAVQRARVGPEFCLLVEVEGLLLARVVECVEEVSGVVVCGGFMLRGEAQVPVRFGFFARGVFFWLEVFFVVGSHEEVAFLRVVCQFGGSRAHRIARGRGELLLLCFGDWFLLGEVFVEQRIFFLRGVGSEQRVGLESGVEGWLEGRRFAESRV